MSYLKEWGFNPIHEHVRLNQLSKHEAVYELDRNLQFFVEHALVDRHVSSPYYYWFDSQNKLYSHPSLRPEYLVESQIDQGEREGATLIGFQSLSQTLTMPNCVVLHYSPKGRASFDEDGKNAFDVDSYKDGQLTLQYFDNEKVHAVGVMVSNENLAFYLLNYFGFTQNLNSASEQERIIHFLKHPAPTQLNLDEFLEELYLMGHGDEVLYKDKNSQEHTLGQTLKLIRQSFHGKLPQAHRQYFDRTMNFLDGEMAREKWTKERVQEIYLRVILNFALSHGLNEVKLMASCGGKIKSTSDIIDLLFNTSLSDHLTTDFLNPSNIVSLYSPDTRKKELFICPKCGFETGERVGNKCPNCKITKEQAVVQGLVTC